MQTQQYNNFPWPKPKTFMRTWTIRPQPMTHYNQINSSTNTFPIWIVLFLPLSSTNNKLAYTRSQSSTASLSSPLTINDSITTLAKPMELNTLPLPRSQHPYTTSHSTPRAKPITLIPEAPSVISLPPTTTQHTNITILTTTLIPTDQHNLHSILSHSNTNNAMLQPS